MIRNLIQIILVGVISTSCNSSNGKIRPNSLDSVKAKIIILRKYGFFEKDFWLSNEDLFDSLHERRIADYSKIFGRFYDPGMQLDDYKILCLDKERTVFGDAEAVVGEGNNRYVAFIKSISKS